MESSREGGRGKGSRPCLLSSKFPPGEGLQLLGGSSEEGGLSSAPPPKTEGGEAVGKDTPALLVTTADEGELLDRLIL